MGLLDGKTAIVTGAGRGVGRSEALLLAREGAAVVVNDLPDAPGVADSSAAREVVEEIVGSGGQAVTNVDDITDWSGGERLVQHAVDTFGQLDILVCNAGIVRDRVIFNMSEQEWDDVIRVHLKGHFVPARFATAHWRARAKASGAPVGGRLILTSSEGGLYGHDGQSNYSAAKAGIIAFGLAVAREMERYGVTCNSICPRARTRMTEAAFGTFGLPEGGFDHWHPDNVAPWVAYLCSDDAADISGHTFCLGGDVVELVAGPGPARAIDSGGRTWNPSDLHKASNDLFAGTDRRFAPFPDYSIPADSSAVS